MKYKLNIASRFLLGMFIAFILGSLVGFFTTVGDCSNGECYVQECEKEGEEIQDSRTGQIGNVCALYGMAKYPSKKYLRDESIRYGFLSAFGLGIILGMVFVERFKKNNLIIKEGIPEGQEKLF